VWDRRHTRGAANNEKGSGVVSCNHGILWRGTSGLKESEGPAEAPKALGVKEKTKDWRVGQI